MAKYKNLIVFQKADELAYRIYRTTDSFPKREMFGITSQIRRASLSIPTNIVEGYSRKGKKELKYFINIALGSLAETEYLFNFSKKPGYHKSDSDATEKLMDEVGKTLWGFYRTL
jgi:four helix bundle protein